MPRTHNFKLLVTLPFDWEYLLAFLRVRATPGVETVTDSSYSRTITDGTTPQTFSVTYNQPDRSLQIVYSGRRDLRDLVEARIKHIFKPQLNVEPIEAFLRRDQWLARFVTPQPGLRMPGGWSAFEIAVRAILGQQVSVPAATTLMGRLVRLAGMKISETEWLFPTPAQILQSNLSGMGVPGARLETVKLLAAFFGEYGEDCLNHPEIKDRLLGIKGIGKWTAGYILMRTADSHDHWPEGDLILRKALSQTKTLIALNILEQAFRKWSPYRGYATIHIWRGYGSSKNSNTNE
jgi:3-methyladenine DNA glycosylase/8-oxoguanine DNA glycosylase